MMKILFAAAALAILFASPAVAQSYDPDLGSGNVAVPSDDPQVPSTVFSGTPNVAYPRPGSYGAYAQVAPEFGWGYAPAAPYYGWSYAPAAPFAYYNGNYGSYAGYGR
jgi:hypothetical protein